jgi:mersacidin/lichenicidin family type 2 lantibiotic
MKTESNAIIRSWKDARFRDANDVHAPSPAGTIELDEAFLADVAGRSSTEGLRTIGCCTFSTWTPLSPFDTNYVKTYGCCPNEE